MWWTTDIPWWILYDAVYSIEGGRVDKSLLGIRQKGGMCGNFGRLGPDEWTHGNDKDGPRGSFHLFLGDPEVVLRDYIKGTALGKINKDLGSVIFKETNTIYKKLIPFILRVISHLDCKIYQVRCPANIEVESRDVLLLNLVYLKMTRQFSCLSNTYYVQCS